MYLCFLIVKAFDDEQGAFEIFCCGKFPFSVSAIH